MKQIFWIVLFSALHTNLSAQTSDIASIEQTIRTFAKAGDNYDVKALEKCLDANYRVVMNRLFGSKKVVVLSREVYLSKIEKKEFGGDTRTVTVHNITINGSTANVKVTMKGSKLAFHSLITLVKNETGKWLLVSDTPVLN